MLYPYDSEPYLMHVLQVARALKVSPGRGLRLDEGAAGNTNSPQAVGPGDAGNNPGPSVYSRAAKGRDPGPAVIPRV